MVLTPNTTAGVTTFSGTFPLAHGETVKITIPYGYTAVLTETGAQGAGYRTYFREVTDDANLSAGFDAEGEPITNGSEGSNPFKSGNTSDPIIMEADHSYQFANFRPAVAPTGLESNHTTPYVLMVTAAGMAGLALIGGIVARRIRRRRED